MFIINSYIFARNLRPQINETLSGSVVVSSLIYEDAPIITIDTETLSGSVVVSNLIYEDAISADMGTETLSGSVVISDLVYENV